MRIKKVLVPIDYSPGSLSALRKAVEVVEQLDASLEILHVLDVPGGHARRDLEHFVSPVLKKGRRVQVHIEQGDAPWVIARVAEREGYDLIVMGTHGRSGVRRALLGSVAEEVVRRSPVPVLTVRIGDDATARPPASRRMRKRR
ncbi:MAG TPA: universal stress protein [bacterium]|nr:universal stress protein [bacterium]